VHLAQLAATALGLPTSRWVVRFTRASWPSRRWKRPIRSG